MTHAFIVPGDCVETLRTFPEACIDAVVTDSPYGLSKQPDVVEVLQKWLAGEDYNHRGGGFMGKTWDSFVPGPVIWREVFRVLKPGGHLVSSFGTRTYDLGVMAVRLAGFEIRDQLAWMYGTGFPKSLNIALAIDKAAGIQGDRGAAFNVAGKVDGKRYDGEADAHPAYVAEDTPGAVWQGWGTGLKPGHEPIVLARKPLAGTVAANVLKYGTGGLHIDACRIPPTDPEAYAAKGASVVGLDGPRSAGIFGGDERPRADSTHELGRWPANVLLDEHAAALLDAQTGDLKAGVAVRHNGVSGGVTSYSRPKPPGTADLGYADSGGASRFFYCAKASKAEREAGLEAFRKVSGGELTGGRKEGSAGLNSPRAGAGRAGGRANKHPTVKPIALMRWLVRLVTPPGGTVLDPFAGSGSTGCAAVIEGFHFVGCELDAEYVALAKARIEHWKGKAA